VAEKTVVVEADPSVTPESMLEKLKKVGPLPSLLSLLPRINVSQPVLERIWVMFTFCSLSVECREWKVRRTSLRQ
jgi:hypothetical protein